MTRFIKKTSRLQPSLRAACWLPPGFPIQAETSHPDSEQGRIAGYPHRDSD